ncbi:MAG: BMP family ABC transporter substrate-binding protein, partial [Ardenticatenaceae bacterium]
MKKVSLWLTLLVMLMVVSACGGTPPETAQPTEEPVAVEEEAAPEEEEAAPEEEEAEPEEEEAEPEEEEAEPEEEEAAPEEEAPSESDAMSGDIEPIRIAVVMPSATTDLAWSQSIYDALLRIQEEAGGEEVVEIAFTEGMFNVTDAAAALRDYAADGYNLVIAHGTQYGSSLFEIAPD